MNINSLESFVQQAFNKTKATSTTRSQSDIATSIGYAKQQQAQKTQIIQQIEQTLQKRQSGISQVTTSQPTTPSINKDYTFSVYV